MTTTISILDQILTDLAAVTDQELAQAARALAAPRENDTPLGTIHSIEARKLWALANIYEARGLEAAIAGKFRSATEEELAQNTERSVRYDSLEKLVRDLFWCQVRDDIGREAWISGSGDNGSSVGVRDGWLLVVVAHDKGPEEFLRKFLGGK